MSLSGVEWWLTNDISISWSLSLVNMNLYGQRVGVTWVQKGFLQKIISSLIIWMGHKCNFTYSYGVRSIESMCLVWIAIIVYICSQNSRFGFQCIIVTHFLVSGQLITSAFFLLILTKFKSIGDFYLFVVIFIIRVIRLIFWTQQLYIYLQCFF
jgi:hypothetical protein